MFRSGLGPSSKDDFLALMNREAAQAQLERSNSLPVDAEKPAPDLLLQPKLGAAAVKSPRGLGPIAALPQRRPAQPSKPVTATNAGAGTGAAASSPATQAADAVPATGAFNEAAAAPAAAASAGTSAAAAAVGAAAEAVKGAGSTAAADAGDGAAGLGEAVKTAVVAVVHPAAEPDSSAVGDSAADPSTAADPAAAGVQNPPGASDEPSGDKAGPEAPRQQQQEQPLVQVPEEQLPAAAEEQEQQWQGDWYRHHRPRSRKRGREGEDASDEAGDGAAAATGKACSQRARVDREGDRTADGVVVPASGSGLDGKAAGSAADAAEQQPRGGSSSSGGGVRRPEGFEVKVHNGSLSLNQPVVLALWPEHFRLGQAPQEPVEVFYEAPGKGEGESGATGGGLKRIQAGLLVYNNGRSWRLGRVSAAVSAMGVRHTQSVRLWRDEEGRIRLGKVPEDSSADGSSSGDGDSSAEEGGSSSEEGDEEGGAAGPAAGMGGGGGGRGRPRPDTPATAAGNARSRRGRRAAVTPATAAALGDSGKCSKTVTVSDFQLNRLDITGPLKGEGGAFGQLRALDYCGPIRLEEDVAGGRVWEASVSSRKNMVLSGMREPMQHFGVRVGTVLLFKQVDLYTYRISCLAHAPAPQAGSEDADPSEPSEAEAEAAEAEPWDGKARKARQGKAAARSRSPTAAPATAAGVQRRHPSPNAAARERFGLLYHHHIPGRRVVHTVPLELQSEPGKEEDEDEEEDEEEEPEEEGGGQDDEEEEQDEDAEAEEAGEVPGGGRPGRRGRASGGGGGGVVRSLRLTERGLRKNEVQLRVHMATGLFEWHKGRSGTGVDIPLEVRDEQCGGAQVALVLRGYGKNQWRLKNLPKWLRERRARSGDVVRMRMYGGKKERAPWYGIWLVREEDVGSSEEEEEARAKAVGRTRRRSVAAAAAEDGRGDDDAEEEEEEEEDGGQSCSDDDAASEEEESDGGNDGRMGGQPPARAPVPAGEAAARRGAGGAAGSPAAGKTASQLPAKGLPAASLTPAHLLGCCVAAAGGAGLPPLLPGELRLCGLTFHPDLAQGVRDGMRRWEEEVCAREKNTLRNLLPAKYQISIPVAAGGLSSNVICWRMAERLGLTTDRDCAAPLPMEPVELTNVEPRRDPQRGGLGLFATQAIRRNAVIGVLAGYVMTAEAGKGFVENGFLELPPAARQELRTRAASARMDEALPWNFLAAAYRLPYGEGSSWAPALEGKTGTQAPLELHMLGYGNLGALVNDPRVSPWKPQSDAEQAAAAAAVNCVVLPVCVRGLVLPVLVALRDIAPGEQLMRDYGAEWWRQLAPEWEVLDSYGASTASVLYGNESVLEAFPPAPTPAASVDEARAAERAGQEGASGRHAPPLAQGPPLDGPTRAGGGGAAADVGSGQLQHTLQQQQQPKPKQQAEAAGAEKTEAEAPSGRHGGSSNQGRGDGDGGGGREREREREKETYRSRRSRHSRSRSRSRAHARSPEDRRRHSKRHRRHHSPSSPSDSGSSRSRSRDSGRRSRSRSRSGREDSDSRSRKRRRTQDRRRSHRGERQRRDTRDRSRSRSKGPRRHGSRRRQGGDSAAAETGAAGDDAGLQATSQQQQ